MSKEVRYNYNPNEGNKEYYKRVEETAKQIAKEEEKKDENYYLDFDIIPEVLKRMGYEILVSDCKREGYEGEIGVVYKNADHYYIFKSGYGSCACCDVWDMWGDGEERAKEFARIFKREDNGTIEFDSLRDMKDYLQEKKPFFFCDYFEKEVKKLLKEVSVK